MSEKAIQIHASSEGTRGVTLQGEGVEIFRLLTLARGLKLERTGMKMCRGASCLTIAKRDYGFKGNRDEIYEQVIERIHTMRQQCGASLDDVLAVVKASSPI